MFFLFQKDTEIFPKIKTRAGKAGPYKHKIGLVLLIVVFNNGKIDLLWNIWCSWETMHVFVEFMSHLFIVDCLAENIFESKATSIFAEFRDKNIELTSWGLFQDQNQSGLP